MSEKPRYRLFRAPMADFVLCEEPDGAITTFWATADCRRRIDRMEPDQTLHPHLADELQQYFEGQPVDFSDVPTPTGPPFFQACWEACREIPRGETISYSELAVRAGSPRAIRAAGQAMRTNPLPIIVPCHRVVGASGSLHGYGGSTNKLGCQLNIKQSLLNLERVRRQADNMKCSVDTAAGIA